MVNDDGSTLAELLGSRLDMLPYAIIRKVENGYMIHYWGPQGSKQYVARTKNDARRLIFNQIFV